MPLTRSSFLNHSPGLPWHRVLCSPPTFRVFLSQPPPCQPLLGHQEISLSSVLLPLPTALALVLWVPNTNIQPPPTLLHSRSFSASLLTDSPCVPGVAHAAGIFTTLSLTFERPLIHLFCRVSTLDSWVSVKICLPPLLILPFLHETFHQLPLLLAWRPDPQQSSLIWPLLSSLSFSEF